MNMRFDVETGATTVDPDLAYASDDSGAGQAPRAVGITSSYGSDYNFLIDAARDQVLGNPGTAVSEWGQVRTLFPLGFDAEAPIGLENFPTGAVFLAATLPGATSSSFYSLTPTNFTSPPSLIGNFPAGVTLRDITTAPDMVTVYAVNAANHLISFASTSPGHLLTDQAISGLQAGEQIGAIAYRSTTGVLYGFGTTGRLYAIDRATAIAFAVSAAPITPAYDGSKPSIDFVPTTEIPPPGAGQIQLVTLNGQNLFIDPDTGAVTAVNAAPTYAPGDEAAGATPAIASAAYAVYTPFMGFDRRTRSFPYAIDSNRDAIIQGTPSATTTEPLGRDVTSDAGFEGIYATLTDVGATESALYQFNLSLLQSPGTFTTPPESFRVGTVGGGSIVRDMVIAPPPAPPATPASARFASSTFAADLASGSAVVTVARTGDMTVPLSVPYLTTGGTAVAGVDYTPVQGTLTFAVGQSTATFTVPLMPGAFTNGVRTVGLELGLAPPQIATLTITAPPVAPVLTPGVASVAFAGTANVITGVDVRFASEADAGLAGSAANFLVQGVTSGRKITVAQIAVASASYDAATRTTHVTFAAPIALATYRSLFVTAVGLAPGGTSSTVVSRVIRGSTVRYRDADGDLVTLRAAGRLARVVVVVPFGGGAASAYVAGRVRVVTGSLRPRKGSNRMATIARFVTGGARLKLARSIVVAQIETA